MNKGCKHRDASYNKVEAPSIVAFIIDIFNGARCKFYMNSDMAQGDNRK